MFRIPRLTMISEVSRNIGPSLPASHSTPTEREMVGLSAINISLLRSDERWCLSGRTLLSDLRFTSHELV
jgi:hypothetical protein